ncbi:hypothetical protein [Halovivax gelatinilyticus]|uniref:hypothetical protein n=1 Tax=Halovivax gelatinilyticus TaxID=2961597 RepID=UPI0020CA94F2|nr:hypothetical protein [Halovivax gelatinilyticus]
MSEYNPTPSEIKTKEDAAVCAHDVLSAEGCESPEVSAPHQTRSTWIVPVRCEDEPWRVHIDPRSGSTRVVRVVE